MEPDMICLSDSRIERAYLAYAFRVFSEIGFTAVVFFFFFFFAKLEQLGSLGMKKPQLRISLQTGL